MKGPKIIISNLYEKNQGVTNVAVNYKKALEILGYQVSFIQFSIGKNDNFLLPTRRGMNLLSRKLSKAFNILFTFPRALSMEKADLLILSDPWLLKATKYRDDCVLIFHDSRQLTRYRDSLTSAALFKHLLRYLNRVKAVIAVSNVAKEELIQLGVTRSKIFVVENSFERSDLLIKRQNDCSKERRRSVVNVYYVASDQRHKKVDFFLYLAKTILGNVKGKGMHFYLVSNIRKNKTKLFNPYIGKGLNILHNVEDMNEFLINMDLLLFPSEYEGFGLPLIEALSFGIPVIARDLPVTREVLGEAAIFIGDLSLDKWEQEILRFKDERYYDQLSKLSLERSMEFDFTRFMEKLNRTICEIGVYEY